MTCEDILPEKGLLEKAATTKRFKYSPLDCELKKEIDIAKNQDKLFKGQINVNNNNREDTTRTGNDVKTEDAIKIEDDAKTKDDETIDDVRYIMVMNIKV